MESETATVDSSGTLPPRQSLLQRTKLPLWVSLLLLVLLAAAVAWAFYAAGASERRLAAQQQELTQKLEVERTTMRREAEESLVRQTRELETLFGAALAWSVRSALLRNNLDEIDQYFGDLVKNPRIPLVLLADAEGKVLRATDRKYLDTAFEANFPAELLTGTDVAVHLDEGRRKRIVLPIQGLTSRLGTVLLVYSPPE